MKRKLLSVFLAAAMLCTVSVLTVPAAEPVSAAPIARASVDEVSVYNAMIALQDKYPDGMKWTNDDFYIWNGGIFGGGYGCVAFAFILSDAAFGNLPARMNTNFEPSTFRVGDVLRYSGHSLIILEVHEDSVVVAEGNFNSSIMWGREVSFDELSYGFEHHLTRYPEDEEPTDVTTQSALGDVYEDGVVDAADAASILVAAAAVGADMDSGFTETQAKNADVNGDSEFNSQDAATVLQYAAATGSGFEGSLEEFMKTL